MIQDTDGQTYGPIDGGWGKQDVLGFFEKGARIIERNELEREYTRQYAKFYRLMREHGPDAPEDKQINEKGYNLLIRRCQPERPRH